ncbi:MAG: hypothetical protein AAF526_14430 [Pseudomonadota bacterium]
MTDMRFGKRGLVRSGRSGLFVFGMFFGLCVGAGLAATAQTDQTAIVSKILYSLSSLAIDTETNAARIIALEERIEDLERQLDQK